MSRFVLIPGAGGSAWYWSKVVPFLQAAGHEAVAVDLPGDDPDVGLSGYADLIVQAAGDSRDVVVVAQSMGAFTAPLVCERTAVRALGLLNAMIPVPGETAGTWWDAVGSTEARVEAARAGGYAEDFDVHVHFLHDVPPELAAEGAAHQRDEVEVAFTEPCEFTAWPSVPTLVLAGADDRFFPAALQQRVARERLGIDAELVPGGHLCAISRPEPLAHRLIAFAGSA